MLEEKLKVMVSTQKEHYEYRAYVLTSHGEDLSEVCRTLHSNLSPHEVVIRTRAAGVCHTDIHFWHGNYQIGKRKNEVVTFSERGVSLPRVPGHEIAGDVYAMGDEASEESGLSVGDRVLLFPWVGCDRCEMCEGGDPCMCSVESRDLGFLLDGGFSEFVKTPSYRYVFKISDAISYELAALLPCSALTAYSTVKRIGSVIEHVTQGWKQTAVVGVIGLGGLGQWALRLLRCVYKGSPIRVIGMDIAEAKVEYVSKEGLAEETLLLDTKKNAQEQADAFLEKFQDQHLNCVLDFANTTDTFQLSIHLLQKCGMLVCTGLHGGLGEIQLPFLALKSLTITGVYTGSVATMKELLGLVTSAPLEPPLITRYPLCEATKALRDLEEGRVLGRAVLVAGQ